MRKSDVEFHSDYGRDSRPAVNVKVRGWYRDIPLPLELGSSYPVGHPELISTSYTDPRFTHDWMDEHLTDDAHESLFQVACDVGWEDLQAVAEDIFGPGVKVWAEGRSGGWAVVDGLSDFDSWDAIDVSRWGRFDKQARAIADDITYRVVDMAYLNVFEPWAEAQVRDYDHMMTA